MSLSIELVRGVPEHIRFYDEESALCGSNCAGDSTRVVEDDQDPIADASLYLCADCARVWGRIVGTVEREQTVRCACDRIGNGTVWKCGEVVPVSIARALKHPAADGLAPVCPDCYQWIRKYPLNDVETPIGGAKTWGEVNRVNSG